MTEDYDPLAEEEAEAAAAEARNIGGRPTRDLEEELIEHSEQGPNRPEAQVRVREEEVDEESPPDPDLYGEADNEQPDS